MAVEAGASGPFFIEKKPRAITTSHTATQGSFELANFHLSRDCQRKPCERK